MDSGGSGYSDWFKGLLCSFFPRVLSLDYWLQFKWRGKLNVGWWREFNEETRKSQCLFFRCYVCMLSHVWLSVTPWIVAHQAPLSIEFFRWEYWNGLPFSLQGILPTQGLNPSLLGLLHCRQILYPLSHQGSPLWGLVAGFLKTKFIGQGFLSAHWVFKNTNAWDTPLENRFNYLG